MTRWWREPSVALAVKTLLGHTFPETLGCAAAIPGGTVAAVSVMSLIVRAKGSFKKSVALLTGDGGFESGSLQRRVCCEP
jgi:hypothetical protein